MNSNRTVVDLQKVAYANFYWCTSNFTIRKKLKPKEATFQGVAIPKDQFAPEVTRMDSKESYPRETMVARATRRKLIDTWEPLCILQLSNSHSLQYTNAKALSLWDAWCAKQFGKTKKHK